jgi:hypothetical protein
MNDNLNMSIDADRAREILKQRESQDQNFEHVETDVFKTALMEMEGIEQPDITQYKQQTENTTEIKSPLGRIEINKKERDSIDVGYINIHLENLPTSGLFYPDGTIIQIRSASVKEIRHYSTLDEEITQDIDEKTRNIIKNCCRIKIPTKPGADYRDIIDIDKLYILFAIQELTFPNGENKLQVNSSCTECNTLNKIDFKKNSVDYIVFDPKLKSIYNTEQKCFVLNFKNGSVVKLYMPTIGKTIVLNNYAQNLIRKNIELDIAFLNVSNFLFEDWRVINDKTIKDMDQKSYGWNKDVLSSVVGIIDLIRKGL